MSKTNSRPNLESGRAETRHPATDKKLRRLAVLSLTSCVFTLGVLAILARGQGFPGTQAPAAKGPWMDKSLSADQRADLLIGQMTLEEKISLLHGSGRRGGFGTPGAPPPPTRSLGGAGFIPGIPRLGIPDLQMADAACGVTRGAVYGRYSTVLPSDISEASSWDLKVAHDYGALIGRELRDQGFNMSLGGGSNLTREPRNGRTFEYKGEDPILAGKLVGEEMKALWIGYYADYQARIIEFSPIVDEIRKWLGYGKTESITGETTYPNFCRWVTIGELFKDLHNMAGRGCTWKNAASLGKSIEKHMSGLRVFNPERKNQNGSKWIRFDPPEQVKVAAVEAYKNAGGHYYTIDTEAPPLEDFA